MAFTQTSPNAMVPAVLGPANTSPVAPSTPGEPVQTVRIYNVSTKATAGTPGSFNNDPPYNITEINKLGPLGNTTPWTTGQRVVLGDATLASWSGVSWVGGPAP